MGDLNIKRDFIKEAGVQSGLLKKKMVKTQLSEEQREEHFRFSNSIERQNQMWAKCGDREEFT